MTAAKKSSLPPLWQNAAAAAVLLAAIFVLTPRFWEPGAESWKRWAAARILRSTGGFPMLSASPLYTTYLVPFLSLRYPLSVRIEYVLTHFLVLGALYRMLNGYCRRSLALLLTCAWAPALALVQGGGTVAGIGCLALYLSRSENESPRAEFLPASLLAATLCHSGYLFFLIGNAVGALFEKRGAWNAPRTAVKAALLLLLVLAALHPSKRPDRNYMMIDPAYAPMAVKDPLTIGFFQIGTWKEVMRTLPESSWIDQDWYFTLDRTYHGATTIGQSFLKSPRVVLSNLASNVPDLLQVPMDFFTGRFDTAFLPLVCLFAVAGAVGAGGLIASYADEGRTSKILATSLGCASLLAALLLTWFNPRYTMALLPLGLLMLLHLDLGARRLVAAVRSQPESRARAALVFAGAAFLAGGLLLNEWTCSLILRKALSTRALFNVRSLDAAFVLGGFFSLRAARRTARSQHPARTEPTGSSRAGALVFASALLVLAAAYFPGGRKAQIGAVLANRAFLSETAHGPSLAAAYPELLREATPDARILAVEDVWLKAFADVDLDKIVNVYGLPPFPDATGATDKMLRGLDQIWVSSDWSPTPSISTQAYLRYRLHVAPFLAEMLARGWTRRDVAYFGTIYSAPSARTL